MLSTRRCYTPLPPPTLSTPVPTPLPHLHTHQRPVTHPRHPPSQDCKVGTGTCDADERQPGLWEFPLWVVQDADGSAIASMDPQVP